MRFSIAGIPVRVSGWFLVLGVFVLDTGWRPASMALWMAAIFLAVLLHELGHAFAARAVGAEASITIYAGGFTRWRPIRPVTAGQRIGISLAGVALELAAGVAVLSLAAGGYLGDLAGIVTRTWHAPDLWLADLGGDNLAFFAAAFVWATMWWGLLNLVPIRGFDGYHVIREVLGLRLGEPADRVADAIAMVAGVAAAAWAWRAGLAILAVLVLLYTFTGALGAIHDVFEQPTEEGQPR